MNNLDKKKGHLRNFYAALWIAMAMISPPAICENLIEEYARWLEKQSQNEVNLKEKSFDRDLLKLECAERIGFEFTNSNNRQAKASCPGNWRRYLKVPKAIALELTTKNRAQVPGKKRNAFIFARNIGKGSQITRKDLKTITKNRQLPANVLTSFESLGHSYLQRDAKQGELLLKTDLKKSVSALLAIKTLPPGVRIDQSHFRLSKLTHDIPADPVMGLDGLDYMTTNKRIKAGQVLRERDLRKAKLIRRNDTVNLVYETNAFSIDAKGVALADGYYGNRVRARNLESNLIVSGIVIDYGTISTNSSKKSGN